MERHHFMQEAFKTIQAIIGELCVDNQPSELYRLEFTCLSTKSFIPAIFDCVPQEMSPLQPNTSNSCLTNSTH